MRKTPMPRRSRPIARGERITPKKRTASDFARIYGSRARVQWVKAQPCVACYAMSPLFALAGIGTMHNAHTETGGMGRKAGYETIVPLCATHHRRYDEHKKPFDRPEAREAMQEFAIKIEAAWQAECARRASLTRKER